MGIFNSSIRLGCAISDGAAVVVAVSGASRHLQIHKYGQALLHKSALHHARGFEVEEAEDALAGLVKALKIKKCDIAVSVPLSQTIYGIYSAPVSERAPAARRMAERYMRAHAASPIKNGAYHVWQVPDIGDASIKMAYCAVEQPLINSWRALCVRAGVRMVRLAVDYPSVLELVGGSTNNQEHIGLIEVGETSSLVTAGTRYAPYFFDTLPWGLRDAYKKNTFEGLHAPLSALFERLGKYTSESSTLTWYVIAPHTLAAPLARMLKTECKVSVDTLSALVPHIARVRFTPYIKACAAACAKKSISFKV